MKDEEWDMLFNLLAKVGRNQLHVEFIDRGNDIKDEVLKEEVTRAITTVAFFPPAIMLQLPPAKEKSGE